MEYCSGRTGSSSLPPRRTPKEPRFQRWVFHRSDWYSATVPTTVLNALVEDKVYPDPYTGMNLRSRSPAQVTDIEGLSDIMMSRG